MPHTPLNAYQCCFVVDDVEAARQFCETHLGWGPFQHFKIPSKNASYRNWQGEKLTEVALGMAGRAQVELIKVHQGFDAIEGHQARIGASLQHLGLLCESSDDSIAALTAAGAVLNDRNQYEDIIFSFMDGPTGTAMFELLERGGRGLPSDEAERIGDTRASVNENLSLDRATVVCHDIDQAAEFYALAFGWKKYDIVADTLRLSCDGETKESLHRRCVVNSGVLDIELVEAGSSNTFYKQRLMEGAIYGDHGLVHIGGAAHQSTLSDAAIAGHWLEGNDKFRLHTGPDGRPSLQLRY